MKRFVCAIALALSCTFSIASPFTVSNLNDSGAGSLRDAVAQANANPGPDTITFSVTGTILLTSGGMQITGPLTIAGPGATNLTVDANSNQRVFSIFVTDPTCPTTDGPDFQVAISGLRLINARRTNSNSGGAILSIGKSLTLDSVVIEGNKASLGGGLAFFTENPGQSLVIRNSQFTNNLAQPLTAANVSYGGAMYIVERCNTTRVTPISVTIENSVFTGNRAQPTTGTAYGGAIATFAYADFTITNTRLVGNAVDIPIPPVVGQQYRGGAFYGTIKSFRLERSEVSDNSVSPEGIGDDFARAGGLGLINNFADLQGAGTASTVKIINSTISGNVSSASSAGMFVVGNVALEIDNSTIASNTAAATRSGGIGQSNGNGGVLATPAIVLASSILYNNPGTNLDIGSSATIPVCVINSTASLVGTLDPQCSVTGSGNLLGVNPLLGPLAFNGGTTRTQALLAGSPALNAGSDPLTLVVDQRGRTFPRTALGGVDMGAYEWSLTPLAGDWNGDASSTIGLHFPETGVFALNNANAPGPASLFFGFGPVDPSWIPLSGDWDGNGTHTPGLYDPATGNFFLRNSNSPGAADFTFGYGPGGTSLTPIAGDWNGDGTYTIGLYDPASGAFFLRNTNDSGPANVVFSFGAGGADVLPVVGDWDGDGTTTIGLYDSQSGFFFLRNSNSAGFADMVFSFGAPSASYVPITGNWDATAGHSIGIYDRRTGVFFMRNANNNGVADLAFGFGPGGP